MLIGTAGPSAVVVSFRSISSGLFDGGAVDVSSSMKAKPNRGTTTSAVLPRRDAGRLLAAGFSSIIGAAPGPGAAGWD